MDKFGEVYLDFNQNDVNIDDLNLNSLWVEFDKGLLSDNIGQQSESIVKLTELFDRYPLPVFVNSGFTRLAKVFQNGNNFLKLQVIRVIEKNHKHLPKVLSADEILKLIFYNIHSNDSICRALTLRALGEISPIISEKHNVQHSIRLALESHDETEAKEAIYAANKFCSLSKYFAASLIDRISEMIEDVQSPLDRKMKLIPLLYHMHHDTDLSSKASALCKSMYYSFPRADISKIILNTLTQIGCKSLTNIPETITFYMKLLLEEPREKIQLVLLKNLNILANKVSHLWTDENILSLIEYTNNQIDIKVLLLKSSEILCTLAKSSNMFFLNAFGNQLDNEIIKKKVKILEKLIENMIFDDNRDVAFNFCLLSSSLLLLNARKNTEKNDQFENLFELTKNGLFSIIIETDKLIENVNISENDSNIKYLTRNISKTLKCSIDLIAMNDENYFKDLFDFVLSLLNSCGVNTINYYTETLLALCSYQNVNRIIINDHEQEEIGEKLYSIKNIFNKLIQNNLDSNLQLKCLNLMFELQTRSNYQNNYINESVEKFLENNKTHLWSVYKLSRMCVRYTCYDLAEKIYENLSSKMTNSILNMSTSDLSYKSWFDFMTMVCKAECGLIKSQFTSINDLISKLNKSLCDYTRAITIFKSSCSRCLTHSSTSIPCLENSNTCFQTRYCELRCEQIKLYIHLTMSLMTYHTIPAPVFQFKSSENFARYGRIAQQMKYTCAELQKLNQKYKDFTSECFDADEHTINILNICKKQNECLIYCINLLISPKTQQQIEDDFNTNFLNIKLNGSVVQNDCEKTKQTKPKFVQYSAELKIIENFFFNLVEKLKNLCHCDYDTKSNQIKQFRYLEVDDQSDHDQIVFSL